MLYVLICVVCLWAMTVNVAVSYSRPKSQFSPWHWVVIGVALPILLISIESIPSNLDELFGVIMFGFLCVICWVTFNGMLNQPKS